RVADSSADSPAQKSGLQKGDIIVAVNRQPVGDSNELRMGISMMKPGTIVNLQLVRDGNDHAVTLTLAETRTPEAAMKSPAKAVESALAGVSVEAIDQSLARQLHVPVNTSGVVVTEVNPSSRAADSGLRQGDVIQEVNHQSVKSLSDFERALHASTEGTLLLVNRQGGTLFVAV